MNRTLKRPMFRMGGSTGTGITSGLDKPRQEYKEGTPNPYNMGNFAPGTGAGFLTQFWFRYSYQDHHKETFFKQQQLSAKEPFKIIKQHSFKEVNKWVKEIF
jgi:hypothetical protein